MNVGYIGDYGNARVLHIANRRPIRLFRVHFVEIISQISLKIDGPKVPHEK